MPLGRSKVSSRSLPATARRARSTSAQKVARSAAGSASSTSSKSAFSLSSVQYRSGTCSLADVGPEPPALDLGHVPHQAEQGEGRGGNGALTQLGRRQAGALHQQRVPVVVEPALEGGPLGAGQRLGAAFDGGGGPLGRGHPQDSRGRPTPAPRCQQAAVEVVALTSGRLVSRACREACEHAQAAAGPDAGWLRRGRVRSARLGSLIRIASSSAVTSSASDGAGRRTTAGPPDGAGRRSRDHDASIRAAPTRRPGSGVAPAASRRTDCRVGRGSPARATQPARGRSRTMRQTRRSMSNRVAPSNCGDGAPDQPRRASTNSRVRPSESLLTAAASRPPALRGAGDPSRRVDRRARAPSASAGRGSRTRSSGLCRRDSWSRHPWQRRAGVAHEGRPRHGRGHSPSRASPTAAEPTRRTDRPIAQPLNTAAQARAAGVQRSAVEYDDQRPDQGPATRADLAAIAPMVDRRGASCAAARPRLPRGCQRGQVRQARRRTSAASGHGRGSWRRRPAQLQADQPVDNGTTRPPCGNARCQRT